MVASVKTAIKIHNLNDVCFVSGFAFYQVVLELNSGDKASFWIYRFGYSEWYWIKGKALTLVLLSKPRFIFFEKKTVDPDQMASDSEAIRSGPLISTLIEYACLQLEFYRFPWSKLWRSRPSGLWWVRVIVPWLQNMAHHFPTQCPHPF